MLVSELKKLDSKSGYQFGLFSLKTFAKRKDDVFKIARFKIRKGSILLTHHSTQKPRQKVLEVLRN